MASDTWHRQIILTECSIVIIFNTALIFTILLRKQLRSRMCNLFLVNLFVAHILESMVGIARSTVLFTHVKVPSKVNLSVNLFTMATILSYLSNVPVTFDRYMAILHPFRYQSMRFKHVLFINSLVWFTAIAFGSLAIFLEFSSKFGDAITFAMTVVMCVVLAVANIRIYRVVRWQTIQLKSIQICKYTHQCCGSATKSRSLHESLKDKLHSTSLKPDDTFGPIHHSSEPASTISHIQPDVTSDESKDYGKPSNTTTIDVKQDEIYENTHQGSKSAPTAFRLRQDVISKDIHHSSDLATTTSHFTQDGPSNHNHNNTSNETNNNNNKKMTKKKKKNEHRDHKKRRANSLDRRCVRSAKLCFTLCFGFMICWTPHALHDILKITNAAPSIIYSDSVLARGTLFVAFFNGIVDPIIYVLMNRELNEQIQRFYRYVVNRVTANKVSVH